MGTRNCYSTFMILCNFCNSLVNELYCDDQPQLSAIKSVMPDGTFDRKLGAEVPLTCDNGYLPASTNGVKAKCVEDTNEAGKWESQDECLCFEPESIFLHSFHMKE